VLGNNHRRTSVRVIFSFLVAIILAWGLVGCGEDRIETSETLSTEVEFPTPRTEQLSEVAPPPIIQQLNQSLEAYQPQVAIVSPKADQVLQDNTVKVEFQVQDLPIFQDPELGMGPHLHVILDNQIDREVYELDQPLVFEDLSPGTHTLRVFASRPWHESFKNEGAYAQTTFHLFTKTSDNNPDLALPLLTYNRPQGSYGAEPIMLDFYLTNAPLHLVAAENPDDEIVDWRIRVTVNGQNFILDRWQPFYLKGFKPGKNWVHLEFLDEQGNPIKNVFNDTVKLINYEPKGQDTLSQLVRGELELGVARSIVEPNYQFILQPTPSPVVVPPPTQLPEQLEEVEEPSPEPIVVPEEKTSIVSEEEEELSITPEQSEEASIVSEEEEEVSITLEQLEEASVVSEEEEEASIVPEQIEEASVVSEEEEEASITLEQIEEESVVSEEEEEASIAPEQIEEESEPITALEPKKSKFGDFFDRFLKLVKGKSQSSAPVIPSEAPASVEEIISPEPAVASPEEVPLAEPVVVPEELEEVPLPEEPVIPSKVPASVEEIIPPEPAVTSPEEVPLAEPVVVPEELEEIPVLEEPAQPESAVTSEEEVPLVEAVPEELKEMPILEELAIPSEPPTSLEELTPPEPAITSDEKTS